MLAIDARAHTFLETIPRIETDFATGLVMGERTADVQCRYYTLEAPTRPDPIVLPDLRTPMDYATTACKHECAILKQSRHIRQAHEVWRKGTVMQRALMLSRAGQCGIATTAKLGLPEVQAIATMDRAANYEHVDVCESSLYNASILKLHGLPYDYSSFQSGALPTSCSTCN